MRLVFIDIETTGLDVSRHEILEIALITEWFGEVDKWHARIRPRHLWTADTRALEINGYSDEAWEDAMTIDQAILQISARIPDKCYLVGYNPSFDWGFVQKALKEHGYFRRRIYMIDVMTLVFEHCIEAGQPRLSLDATREFLGMPLEGSHRAMKDAEDTRQLYHRLCRAGILKRLWWRLIQLLRILRG